jgi:hypothetical protein
MLLNGVGVGSSFNCKSSAHIELWVKVSTTNDVSGLARAQHGAVEGWTASPGGCQQLPNSPGRFYYYSIKGTFDEKGKLFRLNFTLSPNSGGYDAGYIQSGLLLLDSANNWSTPWTIEIPRLGSRQAQEDHLSQTTPGDIGKNSTVSATGWAQLECCSTDAGPEVPTTAPKRPPIYTGEDQYDPWNRRRTFGPD